MISLRLVPYYSILFHRVVIAKSFGRTFTKQVIDGFWKNAFGYGYFDGQHVLCDDRTGWNVFGSYHAFPKLQREPES